MLESLLNAEKAKKKPWEMFFLGILYYSMACLLSLWVFKEYASVVTILFTIVAALPLIYSTIRNEEAESRLEGSYLSVLLGHLKYFYLTMYFFSGLIVASVFWYVFSPPDLIRPLFEVQLNTLMGMGVTGAASASTARFMMIFFNNLKVLLFCVIFSFIYGSGALFILIWNGTVIGAGIGHFIRTKVAALSSYSGFEYLAHYFGIFSVGLLKYTIHGIPEILGYFVGGLAGGIISFGVVKEKFKSNKFSEVVLDASNLTILAVVIILIAAVLEVYITPLVFH